MQAWSDSLRAELACQDVGVLVVSPGYVRTELSRNAITEQVNSAEAIFLKLNHGISRTLNYQGTAHGEMDLSTEKGYSAAWVAEKVLQAVQSGQQEVLLFTVCLNFLLFNFSSCTITDNWSCLHPPMNFYSPGGAGSLTPPTSNPPQSNLALILFLLDGSQG